MDGGEAAGVRVQIYAVEPEALGEPQPTSVCFVDVKKILNPQAISAVGWHVSCL